MDREAIALQALQHLPSGAISRLRSSPTVYRYCTAVRDAPTVVYVGRGELAITVLRNYCNRIQYRYDSRVQLYDRIYSRVSCYEAQAGSLSYREFASGSRLLFTHQRARARSQPAGKKSLQNPVKTFPKPTF